MSIVEMSTIGDNFYNPLGGILVHLLKGVKKEKNRVKDNNAPQIFAGRLVIGIDRPGETVPL